MPQILDLLPTHSSGCYAALVLLRISYFLLPNRPPKSPLPSPPAPPLPCLFASVLIHCFRNSLSFINFGSVTFTPVCASPLSKLNNVGMLEIIYVDPNPLSIISGESYSISAYETPPSSSPIPDVISSSRIGDTARQVLQYDAVQKVIKGVREDVERRRYAEKSSYRRTLGSVSWKLDRVWSMALNYDRLALGKQDAHGV